MDSVEVTAAQVRELADELAHGGTAVLAQGGDAGSVIVRTNISEESDSVFVIPEWGGRIEDPRLEDAMEVEGAARDRGLEPISDFRSLLAKRLGLTS